MVSGWGKCHATLNAIISGFCIIESRKNIARGGGGEGMRELFPTCTSVIFVDHTRLSLF